MKFSSISSIPLYLNCRNPESPYLEIVWVSGSEVSIPIQKCYQCNKVLFDCLEELGFYTKTFKEVISKLFLYFLKVIRILRVCPNYQKNWFKTFDKYCYTELGFRFKLRLLYRYEGITRDIFGRHDYTLNKLNMTLPSGCNTLRLS